MPKNDVWIQRIVKLLDQSSHTRMVKYLSKKFKEKPGIIDLILWRFCADNFRGQDSLRNYIRRL